MDPSEFSNKDISILAAFCSTENLHKNVNIGQKVNNYTDSDNDSYRSKFVFHDFCHVANIACPKCQTHAHDQCETASVRNQHKYFL